MPNKCKRVGDTIIYLLGRKKHRYHVASLGCFKCAIPERPPPPTQRPAPGPRDWSTQKPATPSGRQLPQHPHLGWFWSGGAPGRHLPMRSSSTAHRATAGKFHRATSIGFHQHDTIGTACGKPPRPQNQNGGTSSAHK